MKQDIVVIAYIVATVFFIYGIKRLSAVKTARQGNMYSAIGMLIAVLATLVEMGKVDYTFIIAGLLVGSVIGIITAYKVKMTAMPQMVAAFNGFGGAASALVALSVFYSEVINVSATGTAAQILGPDKSITMALSVIIGCITFTGSFVAFAKLQELISGKPIMLPGRHAINLLLGIGALAATGYFCFMAQATGNATFIYLFIAVASLILGVLLVIPIGGADMPVVISLLNSYSGIAASMAGFVLMNNLLIISGALVGASGLILTNIMCKAMNRSLTNVMFGGFGSGPEKSSGAVKSEYKNVKEYGAEEAAMMFDASQRIVIVPGYGLAVAQAQHETKELATILEKAGKNVLYGIHPVAGRMPGHMNVLLAEANVPYEQLYDMDQINQEFQNTDLVLVAGANDVVNPAATNDKSSPIYGMPILDVSKAQSVLIIKRSLSPGFAGIKNDLFEYDNAFMIFGDAKQVIKAISTELKEL